MVTLADEPWSLVRQVEDLSQEWLGDKESARDGLHPRRGRPRRWTGEVKVGLAVDADGTVHGVTSWMPVYGGDGAVVGWTLDLMRRADGGFRATMEFLIASSCLYVQGRGRAVRLAVRGAAGPVRRRRRRPRPRSRSSWTPWAQRSSRSTGSARCTPSRASSSRGSRPMYMVFRDEADLPRIGIAITRAYLPATPVTQLLAVARHH